MLVDSHCHLDYNDFEEDFSEILTRAKENGVTAMLNAGNNIGELDKQLAISEKYPFIYTAVGVHPHNACEYEQITAQDFINQTKHKKVVGIGECGLDYFYDYAPRETQIRVFREQIIAAQETELPLIIHTRDADDDTISLLKEMYQQKPFNGEIHCFSSSRKLAEFALSIGFYISASGILTFNKSQDIRNIFADIPLDRLLVETDSPFLAPIPKRGRRNEPAFVKYTAERLAQLKNIPFAELAQITSDNFYRLFRKASDKGRYKYHE
ncbi:MAG: TatD family hydrolase [Alphaproteobacteria bacterium]|jgi:TatD DNase family protein|nr:TatD family hydrolase [Alphaproteobacteria bacterium]